MPAAAPPEQPSSPIAYAPLMKSHLPLDAAIADALLNDILERRYPPGAWIREQDVADRFSVSRSPVREALRQVASLGFVVVRPWRGAQVIELSIDDTQHIFDLLEVIYGVVARQAATTLKPHHHAALAAILQPAFDALDGGETGPGIQAAFSFGLYMGRHGASKTSYDLNLRIGRLALWQNKLLEAEDDSYTRPATEILRALLAAISAGDAHSAEALAKVSVSFARTALLARLKKIEDDKSVAAPDEQ